MKKSDKKRDNELRKALTQVCEQALEAVDGFEWLTHFVNYNRFPDSLLIVCVFKTEQALVTALSVKKADYFYSLINDQLVPLNINLKNLRQQIKFDSEEACELESAGNWQVRYG